VEAVCPGLVGKIDLLKQSHLNLELFARNQGFGSFYQKGKKGSGFSDKIRVI
jgi:hypothetical protein